MLLPRQMRLRLKTDTPVLLTPQSVETVPEAVLRDQIALTLSDATRNVAGVAQDFGFNGGTQPALILRGFTEPVDDSGELDDGFRFLLPGR